MSTLRKMRRRKGKGDTTFARDVRYSVRLGANARRQTALADMREIHEVRRTVILSTQILFFTALRRTYKFGRTRARRIMEHVRETRAYIREGYITWRELEEHVFEACKFDIVSGSRSGLRAHDSRELGHNLGSELIDLYFYALYDLYGFKGKRLTRVYMDMSQVSEEINSGTLSADDMKQGLEIAGIELSPEDKDRVMK